jgi:carboxymethylenebutenolidase
MCFPDGSLAPRAPRAGTAGPDRPLTLTASDGTVLMAHECRSATPSRVGIVVLPDVRGLHAYYRELTVRLSEVGWEAVAIDWFGRTADTDDRQQGGFDFMAHVARVTPEGVAADVAAAAEHLRSLGADKVFTLGFCFGGGYSWRQSADTPGLAGCIGFYGRSVQPLAVIDRMTAPLALLVAGADPHIPVADPKQVVDQAPVEAVLHVFDGMPHSFFDRTAPEHAAACDEAWELIRHFVSRHGS